MSVIFLCLPNRRNSNIPDTLRNLWINFKISIRPNHPKEWSCMPHKEFILLVHCDSLILVQVLSYLGLEVRFDRSVQQCYLAITTFLWS
jgi:hypothetical protein